MTIHLHEAESGMLYYAVVYESFYLRATEDPVYWDR
jgi:hypothetical protein